MAISTECVSRVAVLILGIVPNVGLIIGIFCNGWLVDRFGREWWKDCPDLDRRVVLVSLIVAAGFIAILFCAESDGMLLAGELLLGLPLGTINTIARAL